MADTTADTAQWRLTTVESLPEINLVHHVEDNGTAWASKGRVILRRRKGESWQPMARLPFTAPRDFFGWPRLAARASRADKCNLYANSHGCVLTIRSGVVNALEPDGHLRRLLKIQGDSVLHGGICEDPEGWTYFAEYFQNIQRGPVRIWRVSLELDSHEIACEFEPSSIRHIHGVFRDPYDETALWTTVGDYAGECYIVRTRDRFASVESFGDGTQIYRAVKLFFTSKHICWLTDSHLDQNYACRMDRCSGKLETGQIIDCSGWHGLTTTDGMHIGFTTVERGPGIRSNKSSIMVSKDGFHWSQAGSFRKDAWRPTRLFKNGVICCPSGNMVSTDFFISGEGLVGLDGVSRRVRIDCQKDG